MRLRMSSRLSKSALKKAYGWPPEEATRETAWLDGLRGLAALLVLIFHFNIQVFNPLAIEAPYGAIPIKDGEVQYEKPRHRDIWRLPLLRFFMTSGHTQVCIFFVLSGMVLSWGPMGMTQAGQAEKCGESIGSAVFRRWMRLYLPCFAIAWLYAVGIFLELFGEVAQLKQSSILAQVLDYLHACYKFANPLDVKRNPLSAVHRYDHTMWTIPYEFAGSLLVFLLCSAVNGFKHAGRRAVPITAIVAWSFLEGEWTFFLFSTGMLITVYVRCRGGFNRLSENATRAFTITWSTTLFVGLLLAGVPLGNNLYTRPGYEWLKAYKPKTWDFDEFFWWSLASVLIVLSCSHLSKAKQLLSQPVMRYLGRISFMLYLTHVLTLGSIGNPAVKFAVRLLWGPQDDVVEPRLRLGGSITLTGKLLTLVIYIILLALTLTITTLVAHWAEVWIDRPSTRFARTVEDWFKRVPTSGGSVSRPSLPVYHELPGAEDVVREKP